jgi:hypothetical protein
MLSDPGRDLHRLLRKMKLTEGAFEAIYQACDPTERRAFFGEVKAAHPSGAGVTVNAPTHTLKMLLTGEKLSQIRLMAVADGAWDVLPEAPTPRGPGGVQYA